MAVTSGTYPRPTVGLPFEVGFLPWKPPDPVSPEIYTAWVVGLTLGYVSLSVNGVQFELPADHFPPVPIPGAGGYVWSTLQPGDAVVVTQRQQLKDDWSNFAFVGPHFSRHDALPLLPNRVLNDSLNFRRKVLGLITRTVGNIAIVDLLSCFAVYELSPTNWIGFSVFTSSELKPGSQISVYVRSIYKGLVILGGQPFDRSRLPNKYSAQFGTSQIR
jgi:hypothetical protein